MSAASRTAMVAAALGLVAALPEPGQRRPRSAPSRTKAEQRYRAHANRRRKLALASKRRNRRRG